MRCPRCGNENTEGNRFCGMCGATLLSSSPPAPVHPAPQPVRAAAPPASPAPAPQPVTNTAPAPAGVEEETPSITGPSFLGLNDPAPTRKRGSLSIDPRSSTSSNLDYLLEDVEEPKGGGAGKVFLILFALLLAVGFGYLRFRSHGFPWLASLNKPAPAQQSSPETSANPASPSVAPATEPARQPAETHTAPPSETPSASAPASNPPSIQAVPATQPTAQPASSTPAPDNSAANPAGANAAPTTKASDATPSTGADAGNKPADAAAGSDNANPAADKDSGSTPAASASQPAPEAPAAKPRAAIRPIDPVTEAQRYIYGKGVSQDCDHGLRLLKPSANQGNPKAMVEMGALYSAGLCTPRDLPTAYRWFALALRKDPSNDSVQTDLQKLWGEMTQPERQLAIRLTQ